MVNTEIRLIIFFTAKDGEALYSQQKQVQELIVAQIMNSLLPNSDLNWRKVGKTTRPFRCDINEIPYDYTVEVRKRFKGLDLIECLMNYGRRFVAGVQPRQDPGGTLRMNGIGEREREREKTRETSLDRASLCFTFWQQVLYPFTECFQGTRCLLMITQV